MQTIAIHINGIVQGVFFRKFTKIVASENCITGFVCNKADGSVYIEATGAEENLKKFVEWCNNGPKQARVDTVVIKQIPLIVFSSFNIKNFWAN